MHPSGVSQNNDWRAFLRRSDIVGGSLFELLL